MPSQIKVDEIKNVAGQYELKTDTLKGQTTTNSINIQLTNKTTNLQSGIAKAWHWSTEPGSNSDTFNVASSTDQGTGDNFITFTNGMTNATYPMPSAAQYNDISAMDEGHIATTGFRHNTLTHAGSKNDSKCWAVIFGDLA